MKRYSVGKFGARTMVAVALAGVVAWCAGAVGTARGASETVDGTVLEFRSDDGMATVTGGGLKVAIWSSRSSWAGVR